MTRAQRLMLLLLLILSPLLLDPERGQLAAGLWLAGAILCRIWREGWR